MSTRSEEVIGDALAGIEMVRPGIVELAKYDTRAAGIAGTALTLIYEGLVAVRDFAPHSEEEIRKVIAAQITRVVQELAAAKFGAMPGDQEGE
jgi:hypothetical protein